VATLERGDVVKYVLFVGEMLIDLIPDPSGAIEMRGYRAHPGGSVANVAVALARLGGASRFVGKLSEDHFGRMLLNVLQENEVDIRSIPTTAQAKTALVLITQSRDGQLQFTFYRHLTADTLLEVTDLRPQIWEDVAIIHASSLLLAIDPARSATLAALDQACLRGLLVSFDLNVRLAVWQTEAAIRETMSQVLARVDLLKCSAEEIHYLDPSLRTPLSPTDVPHLCAFGRKLLE
jgi:fructokinase